MVAAISPSTAPRPPHQQQVVTRRDEFDTYPVTSTKCLLALIHSRASRHFVVFLWHFVPRA